MWYLLSFLSGATLGVISIAFLWANSDTLLNELKEERRKRKQLEDELRETKQKLLFYKAQTQRYESILRIDKWRI